jgi:predicted DNA-binding transcriptional regulator YafY
MQTDMSGGLPMSRTTFNRHRLAIEEMFDLCIGCKESGRKSYYYIENIDVLENDKLQHWMLDALSIGKLLMENITLKDRIVLEKIPAGKHFLNPIIDAMKQNRKLVLTYRKFGQEEPYTITVEPYAIKVFKQRWYLLAKNYKRSLPTIYALDRVLSLQVTDELFEFPEDFSTERFFKDFYGVLCHADEEVERIVIRAYPPLTHYLRTLPLHHSQKELQSTPEYADFEFYLHPTFDFLQELFAQTHEVEVLEPLRLRNSMKEYLLKALKRYE